MNTHRLYLIGGKDEELALLTEAEVDGACHVSFEYRGKVAKASADDFFQALCEVRSQLEAERLIPFCYGASLNVYPSGMGRDMALGKVAYKMALGQQASQVDLVDIFAEGPDVIPSFVSAQREFFEEWLASLSR